MKNISRSAQGIMGREDTKVIKNVKCKSIKRDFENDRDFFWRQSTMPVKISNLLFVLAIRERNIVKVMFLLVWFLGCVVTASLLILLMPVFTRLR